MFYLKGRGELELYNHIPDKKHFWGQLLNFQKYLSIYHMQKKFLRQH